MKIEHNKLISFKSTPYFFVLELNGIKPNTVRVLTKKEAEEVEIRKGSLELIQIVNTDDSTNCFVKRITNIEDITDRLGVYPDQEKRIFVFSWRHY